MDIDGDSLGRQDEEDIFWGARKSSERPRKRARKCAVPAFVCPGERVHPRSAYWGSPAYNRAISAKSENEVLSSFLADEMMDEDDDEDVFISYVLDDFVVYRTPDVKPLADQDTEGAITAANLREQGQKGQGEYELPSAVYVAKGLKNLVFDGVLKSESKEEALYAIPFETLSISNLATPKEHNVTKKIWIQSRQGAKVHVRGGVWYELGFPAKEYIEHWEAFEWLALFVKYVSDALEVCVNRGEEVTLSYFRSKFAAEMRQLHGGDHVFKQWMTAFGKDDFRIPMATHAEFLWHQIQTAIPEGKTSRKFFRQALWGEILPSDLTAIPPAHSPQHARSRCVVTPYVNDLFNWIFNDRLEVVESEMGSYGDGDVLTRNPKTELRDLSFSNRATSTSPVQYQFHHREYRNAVYPRFSTQATGSIRVGDVIELPREEETPWKGSTQRWYALVTNRWKNAKDAWKLSILWLYWPEDVALCKSMKYPFSNELFFSDHCECGRPIALEDVIRKVAVEFFCIDGKPEDPNAEFFIRQKYVSIDDNTHIVSLKAEDISPEALCPCPCRRVEDLPVFQPGDFVLVSQRNRDRLQPYQFEAYENKQARLRKLDRRREVDGTGKVNELIWTTEMEVLSLDRVLRKCHVVRVEEGEEIPRLADWAGSSDWFFYLEKSHKTEGVRDIEYKQDETLVNLFDSTTVSTPTTIPEDSPESLSPVLSKLNLFAAKDVQYFGALEPRVTASSTPGRDIPQENKLRGLDLFCGGGNFGRGVADGGAVHHTWAIDIDINALHTYRANLEADKTNLYLGSINNFLFDIMKGRPGHLPQPGDIDLILAGSPCQGFSNANRTGRETEKSLRNAVLVCATLTAIDLFRPKYAILENVPAMASPARSSTSADPPVNVANQMMCALIGMGYQCRVFILDAYSFGVPQSRSRIFIEIAAPGCILPEVPPSSHAHPPSTRHASLGKTAANLRFAPRDLESLTAFPPVQLRDSWDDLPSIGNGHLNMCIPYPDHRPYWIMNARDRAITAHIPASDSAYRHPNYEYAFSLGLIPHHLKLPTVTIKQRSRRFERHAADELAGTVTCYQNPMSGPCGRALHYRENRVFTILEAKRLQGFFDTDVLVGVPRTCFKIIGNSVCRQVAFALGGKLADAVMSGTMKSGGRVREKTEISRREKLNNGPSETKLSRTRSIAVMVMVQQKKSSQGVGGNVSIRKGFTAPKKVSIDTTVNLSATEENDGIEISVIRRSREDIVINQTEITGDQDMYM